LVRAFWGSSPSISPHVGRPATLVHLDEVKISEHTTISSQTKLLNHLTERPVGLIIVPASFANETVVNQDLLLCESPSIGEAPVENLRIGFSRKDLSFHIFIAHPQIPACPAIESLP
jgi:hypothetical protein